MGFGPGCSPRLDVPFWHGEEPREELNSQSVDKQQNRAFTKSERILKRKQFLDIYARGTCYRGRLFYIYFLENRLEHSRLGLTASRKVGGSVVQNLVKRRFREIFREIGRDINPPSDIVINATRSTVRADFEVLKREFLKYLEIWERK